MKFLNRRLMECIPQNKLDQPVSESHVSDESNPSQASANTNPREGQEEQPYTTLPRTSKPTR